jgi:hypothetical protein
LWSGDGVNSAVLGSTTAAVWADAVVADTATISASRIEQICDRRDIGTLAP